MADIKEWRCFFCDDVFDTREAAALHFGAFDSCEPDVTACKLMAHQQHVLEYIRGLEEEISQYQAENHPTIKAMYAVEDKMRRAVIKAEELGYARGVSDMKSQGYCIEPAKHFEEQQLTADEIDHMKEAFTAFLPTSDLHTEISATILKKVRHG